MPVTKEDTRALARIVKIDKVVTHPNADKLDIAVIGGWQCVVKRGEFKEGDFGIYFEIDSLLPIEHPLFNFLQARTADLKTDSETGTVYAKVRTIKLRKELSQGLLLSVPEDWNFYQEGENFTEVLGVMKWVTNESDIIEKAKVKKKWIDRVKDKIQGFEEPTAYLPWPEHLKKSDLERVQNLPVIHQQAVESGEQFERTVKLNGSSTTFFLNHEEGRARICSRNNMLRLEDVPYTFIQSLRLYVASWVWRILRFLTTGHFSLPSWKFGLKISEDTFVKYYKDSVVPYQLMSFYQRFNRDMVVQGELIGPGINGNKEGVKRAQFYVYSVYEYKDGELVLLLPEEAKEVARLMCLDYIPVLEDSTTLHEDIKTIIKQADGKGSMNSKCRREGVVYKSLTRNLMFKVISNKYLLEEEKEEQQAV